MKRNWMGAGTGAFAALLFPLVVGFCRRYPPERAHWPRVLLLQAGVPARFEMQVLDAYVHLVRARFEDRLSVDIDAASDTRSALVPQLILQNASDGGVLVTLQLPYHTQ
jgi:hypothetical protein